MTPKAIRGSSKRKRLAREIVHHRQIAAQAEQIWNWNSPAGKRRAARRANFFIAHGELGRGRRALELGCGTGLFLEQVATSEATVIGIDLSSDLLSRAATRVKSLSNVGLICGNAEELPYPSETFDAVYGSSILHHLDVEAALKEAYRVLRPGGHVVFTEPNLLNPQVAFMFHFGPTKNFFGVSPDEMAFTRFRAHAALQHQNFVQVTVDPFDFLHPSTSPKWIDTLSSWGAQLEQLPLIREIAGSILIRARKL